MWQPRLEPAWFGDFVADDRLGDPDPLEIAASTEDRRQVEAGSPGRAPIRSDPKPVASRRPAIWRSVAIASRCGLRHVVSCGRPGPLRPPPTSAAASARAAAAHPEGETGGPHGQPRLDSREHLRPTTWCQTTNLAGEQI